MTRAQWKRAWQHVREGVNTPVWFPNGHLALARQVKAKRGYLPINQIPCMVVIWLDMEARNDAGELGKRVTRRMAINLRKMGCDVRPVVRK